MDFALTSEQQGWVDRAYALAAEFAGRAREYDEAAEFPAKDFERLREEGFLTLAVPKKYGGSGLPSGNAALIPYLVVEALATTCPTTAWDLAIHFHQCSYVARLGSEELCRRVLGDVVNRGALMGSIGSEVNPQQVKAAKDTERRLIFEADFKAVEGGFIANGSKFFCSMAPAADYLSFWALAPGTNSTGEGLSQAVVPKDTPGLTFDRGAWDEVIGLRASISWSVHLKDVFIPWENIIGQPGDWVQKDPYTFELSHTSHLLGIAQGAFNWVLQMLRDRPYLVDEDTVLQIVGEMDAALQATRTSFWYANWLTEEEQWGEAVLASIRALHTAKATALMITTKAFEVCGTRALFKFHPIEMFLRDTLTASLHTRQSQLMRLLAEAVVEGGEFFPKQKYGEKVDDRKTWKELGLVATPV